MAPSELLTFIRERLLPEGNDAAAAERQFRKFATDLYQPAFQRLGFESKPDDSDETRQFRADVINFLAFQARDPQVRREATRRAMEYIGYGGDGKIHTDAIDPNLVETALSVAAQETGEKFFDALISLLRTSTDTVLRTRVLYALGRVQSPKLLDRVMQLVLDTVLRTNEIFTLLDSLVQEKSNREPVWQWVRNNYDALVNRMSPTDAGGLSLVADFCNDAKATEVKKFFEERVAALPGGERNLARALERIAVCAARVNAHRSDPLPWHSDQDPAKP
jgi:alanyl aminopeptidase